MPEIRQYPQADGLLPTDAFVIDRLNIGTMFIQAQNMGLGVIPVAGANAFQVTPGYDLTMPNSTGTGGDINIPFAVSSGGSEPEAFDPTNVFIPLLIAPGNVLGNTYPATCTVSGNVIAVSAVSAEIQPPVAVSGPGVPSNTVLQTFGTGTSQTGTYGLNNSFTIASPTVLTFTQLLPCFIAPAAGLYRLYCQANMEILTGTSQSVPLALFLQQSTALGVYVAEVSSSAIMPQTVNSTLSMWADGQFECSAGDIVTANVQYNYPVASGALMTCYAFQSYFGGCRIS